VTTIELDRVAVAYDGVSVLEEIHARVPSGSWVGLIGPNGAGKTTLLRAVAGLVPAAGEVRLDGSPAGSLGRRERSRAVAYLPQRPVVPEAMRVGDYVLMGRTPYIPYLGAETRRDREVAAEVLGRLDLASLADRPLGALSGGEVQRAVLGRALAQQAPVLLLDEPTSALDVGHQQQVLELIDELRSEQGLTVLAAMHDLTLAGQFADRLLLLSGGRIAAEGPAREILTERTIWEHYGARIRVVEDPEGGLLVIPTRSSPSVLPVEEAPA
jgi:iron complex transport system ATP-binding protein